MDFGRTTELSLRLQHRHEDGTWGQLEPRSPHDAADLDPERRWGVGTTYACTVCDEEVHVSTVDDPAEPRGR